MTLLLTCFEPFGGETVNASAEAARLLQERIGPWTLIKRQLPVVFGAAGDRCLELIQETRPQAVLLLGQAAGRTALTPELTARNWRWARIPDNAGRAPKGEPVLPGGEDARFAGLPVEAMVQAIRAAGYPAALSCSAGYYVCNDLYYTVLARAHQIPAAFLHVPASGTLAPEITAKAIEATIPAIPL